MRWSEEAACQAVCVSQVQLAKEPGLFWARRKQREREQTQRWRFPFGENAKFVLKESDINMRNVPSNGCRMCLTKGTGCTHAQV